MGVKMRFLAGIGIAIMWAIGGAWAQSMHGVPLANFYSMTDEEQAALKVLPAKKQAEWRDAVDAHELEKARQAIPYAPTHSVVDFDQKLYSSSLADELDSVIRKAKNAAVICDRGAYDDARKTFDRMYSFSSFYSDDGDSESNMLVAAGLFALEDAQPKHDYLVMTANKDAFPAFPKRCERRQEDPQLQAALSFNWATYGIFSGFLGQEQPGSGVPEVGLLEADESISTVGGSVRLEVPISGSFLGTGIDFIFIDAGGATGDTRADLGPFDPAGDARLLLPGPTGGASGLSLGTSEAFPNDATSLLFDAELNLLSIGIGAGWRVEADSGAVISPYVGFSYKDLSLDQSLQGLIPGYNGNFGYESEVDVSSYALAVGADVIYPLPSSAISLVAGIEGRVAVQDISGRDSLNWLAFTTTGGGTADLDGSQTDVFGSANAGISFDVGSWSILAQGTIALEGIPEIIRGGTDPSRVNIKTQEAYGASVTVRKRF